MATDTHTSKDTLKQIDEIIYIAQRLRDRISIAIFIVGLSALSYHLVNKYFDIAIIYDALLDKVSTPFGTWTTVIIISLIGISLAIFKSKQQFWYGIFETAFALTSCYYTVKNFIVITDKLAILIALGSTLYLIVRGISNIVDGIEKSFWLKDILMEFRIAANSISAKSATNLLKDRETLVYLLLRILKSISNLI